MAKLTSIIVLAVLVCLTIGRSVNVNNPVKNGAPNPPYLGVYANKVLQYWPPSALAQYLGNHF